MTSPDDQRTAYLSAYRAANPGKSEPELSWQAGWWVISSQRMPMQRVRATELIAMTQRLEERADER